MFSVSRWFVCLALLPSLGWAAGSCERLVATASPDAPPYAWRDPADPGRLIGASVDVLHEVATQLGLKISVVYAGRRSQAMDEVRTGRMDILADAVLSTADLEHFDYIYPPLAFNDYLVWSRQGASMSVGTLADLAGHPGLISAKARLSPGFSNFATTHLDLHPAENLTRTLQQLMLGQAEYAIAPRYAGAAAVAALGLTGQLIPHELAVDRPGIHLALAQDSACNDGWLRGQLSKKMTELAASGGIQAILQRNAERWKLQQQAAAGAGAVKP
ncbi:transporter substrate-binding domain-containing protein [Pseudomonas sp. RIT-PI-S]|uniref:substrate-binding periplasmic protein n=1 Tax=Pseudomonas sp. RIT-PI-S TaxID=3035295 RepID=UPI0021DA40FF|nr:transporter substrate-binding domain-containing protein [Pseudomonas sp. RIT-PI-S]